MTYENGGQLDRALKRAVRDRGGDPGGRLSSGFARPVPAQGVQQPRRPVYPQGRKRAARAHPRRPRHARHRLRDGICV